MTIKNDDPLPISDVLDKESLGVEARILEAISLGRVSTEIGFFFLIPCAFAIVVTALRIPYVSVFTLVFVVVWALVLRFLYFPTLITIPRTAVGMVEQFEERTGEILREGLHRLALPYIFQVTLLSEKVGGTKVTVTVICDDNISVEIEGDLQYRLGKHVVDSRGRNRFVEMEEIIIRDGVNSAVEQELNFIAERNSSDRFIRSKEAILLIIQAVLSLDRMPHKDPNFLKKEEIKFLFSEGKDPGWRVVKEGDERQLRNISANDRLDFYENNMDVIHTWIRTRQKNAKNHSELEGRYGLDVVAFALNKVQFDKETREAQQAEKQAKLITKAAEELPPGTLDPMGKALALTGRATQHNFNLPGLVEGLGALGEGLGRGMRGSSSLEDEPRTIIPTPDMDKKGGAE